MRYRWLKKAYSNSDTGSVIIPEAYFSFIEEYDMNDSTLFTFEHSFFLHELWMYSRINPSDSLEKWMSLFEENNENGMMQIMKNMIIYNSEGFTRDVLFSKQYILFLRSLELDLFESYYDSSLITKPYFRNIINAEYLQTKDYLAKKISDESNITAIDSSLVSNILLQLTSKYSGNVIYIDFWAPWCSPCMKEMPNSKEIQEYFRNENVVFLFLANRCKEDSWKATIANKNLAGEHILLTDDQFKELSKLLNIDGIPHYTLIDHDGNIVFKDAPRPSEKNKLISEIIKLLS